MAEAVIRVENLSKRYYIGARQREDTLRDKIMSVASAPLRSLRRFGRSSHRAEDAIWALRDVSFEVGAGEVVGVIGRNGAGKSTLLKVLTRITEPTGGRAELRGRVGSLLEVGTGFHPELTGRENIFLSGAVLGMSRPEIKARLDEIVAFSGIERFIDTPVKRYSSGMHVRLGFAVAAHLEPEILLVDEVLAVGDAEFQKKCLGKMGDVAKGGRTILFVSHNMAAIQNLCGRCLLMADGRVACCGPAGEVIREYLQTGMAQSSVDLRGRTERVGNRQVLFTHVMVCNMKGEPVRGFAIGEGCKVCLDYASADGFEPRNVEIGVAFISVLGTKVVMFSNVVAGQPFHRLPPRGRVICSIPALPVASGEYTLGISISCDGVTCDWIDGAMRCTVLETDFYRSGRSYAPGSTCVYLPHEWQVL